MVDVVATLRVLGEHRSGGAVMRLLTGARWRVGPRDLAMLRRRAAALVRPPEEVEPDAVREPLSLVEALDDLGEPAAYSPEGHRRMSQLAAELRRLRRRLTAPLAELVADVEHVIGVDVEVAARADRAATGRVHLDRFLDVAADFAAEAGDASLGAFLAYLDAAEDEENGLEAGEVQVAAERVQVLTVHGAKGLEWDVVAVPGLAGEIFPGLQRGGNWTRSRHELPAPLRGDSDGLPALDLRGVESRKEVGDRLKSHAAAVTDRFGQEERRLAYVALTRARSRLLVSGYAWDTTAKPRPPSPYLEAVCALVEPDQWFRPDPDAANPRTVDVVAGDWPFDPFGPPEGSSGTRRRQVEQAAMLVRRALAALPGQTLPGLVLDAPPSGAATSAGAAVGDPPVEPVDDQLRAAAHWRHDVDVLLAERDRLRRGRYVDVPLPQQLSVSQLVDLDRDPAQFARALRRPLPRPPAPWARRGTAFHTWLEQRWQQQTLLDVDELPGAADEDAEDAQFAELRAAFEASAWADRTPVEVEVPFEMSVGGPPEAGSGAGDAGTDSAAGGRVVRGRMDAVFTDGDGRWLVVDWKTGRRPTGAAAQAAAVQLAAYRLAWARLAGLGDDQLHRVRAAFHYVRSNETVEPAALLDADGLRALLSG